MHDNTPLVFIPPRHHQFPNRLTLATRQTGESAVTIATVAIDVVLARRIVHAWLAPTLVNI